MKYICSILLFSTLLSIKVTAQLTHFVFIQSESRQPFNITLNKKVYSSTATGYLIIPKLAEGQYAFTVGFGGNSIPDQQFHCVIEKKDLGFNLKNFGEKGWGLFNLQTFNVTMAREAKAGASIANVEKPAATKTVENNSIAKTSENTFQPEIKPVVEAEDQKIQEEVDPAPIKSIKEEVKSPTMPVATNAKDSVNVEVEKQAVPSQQTTEAKEDHQVNIVTPRYKSTIQKISELKGSEAYYITYVDANENSSDTIQLLIPNIKAFEPEKSTSDKDGLKFLDINTKQEPETSKSVAVPSDSREESVSNISGKQPSARCTAIATDEDFFKLRKKMAAGVDNDAMLSEAKKMFKTRCFTTLQVKNLSYLFLTDQSRYQFFDVAYPFVSDPNEFPELSKELSDAYYISRFKAMLLN